jgi:hypothetical protein
MDPPKILTPVDGSPASLRAVDFALQMLSRTPGGSLILLNVTNVGTNDPMELVAMPDWSQDVASRAADAALKGALSKCKTSNIGFKPMVRAGQIAKTIDEVAREENVDQIMTFLAASLDHDTRELSEDLSSLGIAQIFITPERPAPLDAAIARGVNLNRLRRKLRTPALT